MDHWDHGVGTYQIIQVAFASFHLYRYLPDTIQVNLNLLATLRPFTKSLPFGRSASLIVERGWVTLRL